MSGRKKRSNSKVGLEEVKKPKLDEEEGQSGSLHEDGDVDAQELTYEQAAELEQGALVERGGRAQKKQCKDLVLHTSKQGFWQYDIEKTIISTVQNQYEDREKILAFWSAVCPKGMTSLIESQKDLLVKEFKPFFQFVLVPLRNWLINAEQRGATFEQVAKNSVWQTYEPKKEEKKKDRSWTLFTPNSSKDCDDSNGGKAARCITFVGYVAFSEDEQPGNVILADPKDFVDERRQRKELGDNTPSDLARSSRSVSFGNAPLDLQILFGKALYGMPNIFEGWDSLMRKFPKKANSVYGKKHTDGDPTATRMPSVSTKTLFQNKEYDALSPEAKEQQRLKDLEDFKAGLKRREADMIKACNDSKGKSSKKAQDAPLDLKAFQDAMPHLEEKAEELIGKPTKDKFGKERTLWLNHIPYVEWDEEKNQEKCSVDGKIARGGIYFTVAQPTVVNNQGLYPELYVHRYKKVWTPEMETKYPTTVALARLQAGHIAPELETCTKEERSLLTKFVQKDDPMLL